jgi:hypothetical protein
MQSSARHSRDPQERRWLRRGWPFVVMAGMAVLGAGCSGAGSGGPVTAAGGCGSGRGSGSATAGLAAGVSTPQRDAAGKVVAGGDLALDYRPSQVTGWSAPYSPTTGGHVAARDFTCRGKAYRVSLLPFGQLGKAPDPVYEKSPADPVIKFRQTLATSWGRYYRFRYRGGLPPGARLAIESYSVRVSDNAGALTYGNDLYLVYQPGPQPRLPLDSDLQFIQVLWSHGPSVVDSTTANPFYGSGSGLTSVYGNQSVSFYDNPAMGHGAGSHLPPGVFRAEVFLAQDTGIKDAAGKDIVNIFGGVKWGWQMHSLA